MRTRNFLFFLLMLLPFWVLADNHMNVETLVTAANRQGDISRNILSLIFGDIIADPLSGTGQTSLVSTVIFSFNAVVIVLAGVYLGWIMLKKTTRGAQLGQVLEGATDTGNKIIKTTGGFIMLIPIPAAGGWNLAQLFFLWSASLIGVGGANVVSDTIAEGIISGQTVYTQPVVPEVSKIAQQMFETNLCQIGINKGLEQLKASGTAYEESAKIKVTEFIKKPELYSITYGNGSAICGGFSFKPTVYSDSQYSGFNTAVKTKQIGNTILNASRELFNDMQIAALEFDTAYWERLKGMNGKIPDANTKIQNAARKYQHTIAQVRNSNNETEQGKQFFVQEVKNKGWLVIGSMYRLMTTANTDLQNVVAQKPTLIPTNLQGDVAALDYYQGLYQAYQSQQKNSGYSAPLGTEKAVVEADGKGGNDIDVYSLGGYFARQWNLGKGMNELFSAKWGSGDGQTQLTNPILKAKEVGDYAMVTAELGLASWIGVNVVKDVTNKNIGGKIVNFFTGAGDAVDTTLQIFNGWVFTATMILLILGGIMSVYIPIIPTINWIVAITDWIIAIITGAVGSTLWAATHLNVGESNADRSTTGYIFIIDVLIRPLLMVVGFLFASLVLIALGTLLDLLFYPAFMIAQGTSTTGLVTIFFLLIIYARIMSGLVLRIFTLPIRLPNWVISWIGNKGYDSILGDMTSHVSGIFAGLGRATHAPAMVGGKANNPKPKGDGIDAG